MLQKNYKFLIAISLTLLLLACGGSNNIDQVDLNSNNPNDPVDPVDPVNPTDPADPSGEEFDLSGSAVKGVIANGVINVYDASDLTTVLYSPTDRTASDGSYALTVPAEAEFAGDLVVVEVVAADDGSSTMKCDIDGGCALSDTVYAFGDSMPLPSGFSMQSIGTAPEAGGSAVIHINALSNLVTELALEDGATDAEDVATANELVGDLFDIDADDFSQLASVDLTEDTSGADAAQQKAAVIGAAMLEEGLESEDGSINAAITSITDDIVNANAASDRDSALNDLAEAVLENAIDIANSDDVTGVDQEVLLELVVNELLAETDQIEIDPTTSPSGDLEGLDQAKAFISDLRTLSAAFTAEEIAAGADPFEQALTAASDLASDDVEALLAAVMTAGVGMEHAVEAYMSGQSGPYISVDGVEVNLVHNEEEIGDGESASLVIDEYISDSGDTVSLSVSVNATDFYEDQYGENIYISAQNAGLSIAGSAVNAGASISIDALDISLANTYYDSYQEFYDSYIQFNDCVENCENEQEVNYFDDEYIEFGEISVEFEGSVELLSEIPDSAPLATFDGQVSFSASQLYLGQFLDGYVNDPCSLQDCFEPCFDEDCFESCFGQECEPPCDPQFDDNCLCGPEGCPDDCFEGNCDCGPDGCPDDNTEDITVVNEYNEIEFEALLLALSGTLSTDTKSFEVTLAVDLESDQEEYYGAEGAQDFEIEEQAGPEIEGSFNLIVTTDIIGIGDENGVTIELFGATPVTDEDELEENFYASITVSYAGREFNLTETETDLNELLALDATCIINQDDLALCVEVDADGVISGTIEDSDGVLATIEERSGLIFVVYSDSSFESLI